jgi:hypothetical protein
MLGLDIMNRPPFVNSFNFLFEYKDEAIPVKGRGGP